MKVLIWDLPTRLFHWLFAGSVVSAFIIAKVAEKETPFFYLHVVFATLAFLLLIWRIIWGFVGSPSSQWRTYFFSPKELLEYLTSILGGKGKYFTCHNPAGAYATLGIMITTLFSIASGVLITQSELFEELHEVLPVVTIVLAAFHIAGVLIATLMHKETYILSMINGLKTGESSSAITHQYRTAAFIMIVFVFGGWFYFIKGFDRQTAVFTAPGTQWSYQIGEAEATDQEFENEIDNDDNDGNDDGNDDD